MNWKARAEPMVGEVLTEAPWARPGEESRMAESSSSPESAAEVELNNASVGRPHN